MTVGSANASTSTLQVAGSSAPGAYTGTPTSLSPTAAHHRVEVTALATITLPSISGITSREYVVINCHTAAITVRANAAELIGNTAAAANTYSVPAGTSLRALRC